MDEILKAIESLKQEINKRIDLLEYSQYKENTLLIKDIHKKIGDSDNQSNKIQMSESKF